ncbi:MAG: MFS transporter [Chloroflexi bacterium]|nr:MFS transporter [Chloroflexota bacterium]
MSAIAARGKGFVSKLASSYSTLGDRSFRYFFFSSVSINFAMWFQMIGLGWLVFKLTNDPAQMGIITAVQGGVLFFLSPLAGALSDRVHRRRLLIITTAISAVQSLALAALVGSGSAQVWHLYIFAVLGGAAASVSQPVRQAFVYDLVGREGIVRAVPINNLSQSGVRVLGPAVAGIVIGFSGTASAFYIQGILTLVSMGLTVMIGPTSQAKLDTKEGPLRTLSQGIRYAAGNPAILGLLGVSMVPALLVYPYLQFLPFFLDKLDAGPRGYGVLATGAGYGGVIGLTILTLIGEVRRKGVLLLLAQALYPTAVALFTLTNSFPLAMACLVLAGFFNSFYMATLNTLFLISAREDMRGRVMALHTMQSGVGPLGSLAMGFAIRQWGPSEAILGFMLVAIALVAFGALLFGSVRRL